MIVCCLIKKQKTNTCLCILVAILEETEADLSTKTARQAWEVVYSDLYIAPVLTDLNVQLDAARSKLATDNDRLGN